MPRSVFLSKQLIKNDTDRLTLISGPCLLENEKLVRQVAKSLIKYSNCLLYTSPSPRDALTSRMPSSA